jgi:hypothetical protein
MGYLPLCESAKKGRVCIDDLCRGADVTLCGFDVYEYERMTESPDDPAECFHGVHYLDDCADCDGE